LFLSKFAFNQMRSAFKRGETTPDQRRSPARLASSSLLCAAAVRSGVLHFLLGLAGSPSWAFRVSATVRSGCACPAGLALEAAGGPFWVFHSSLIFGEFSEGLR